jgi:hypothetical protein
MFVVIKIYLYSIKETSLLQGRTLISDVQRGLYFCVSVDSYALTCFVLLHRHLPAGGFYKKIWERP